MNIDFEAIKRGDLLKENIRLKTEIEKLNIRLRAYKGWRTKINKNKFASE